MPDGTGKHLSATFMSGSAGTFDIIPPKLSTSVSSDEGVTWTEYYDNVTPEPLVDAAPGPGHSSPSWANSQRDEKIAFRYDNGKPELIIVYRAQEVDPNAANLLPDGVFVNFSSDYGKTWGTAIPVERHDGSDGFVTVRPSIAVDNNTGVAYISWSTTDITTSEPTDSVYVAEIPSNSQTVTGITPIMSNNGYESLFALNANDITVDPNDNFFALWRIIYYKNTNYQAHNLLYYSELKSGGSLWTRHLISLGSSQIPDENEEYSHVYIDYPSMTISPCSTCGTDSVFVAYTKGGNSNPSGNPSEVWLASASLSSSGAVGTWKTYNIQADGSTSPTAYTFQFEPALCPDGLGGVFLLYYSAKPEPTDPSVSPLAMLFESGSRGPTTMLSTVSTNTVYPNDYVGIVYDAVNGKIHPAWADAYSSTYGPTQKIFTTSIAAQQIGGVTPNPPTADLGFSNQRRAVMTDNRAHVVGMAPMIDNPGEQGIWYTEQTSNSDETATNWTNALELDNRDKGIVVGQPAVAVYQSTQNNAQKAVAAVWASIPVSKTIIDPLSAPQGLTSPMIYIRVKEFNDCEKGGIYDWSPVDSFAATNLLMDELTRPVVAPLTVPTSHGSNDRYLIGWIVTYAADGKIMSRTYLRGSQTGFEYPTGPVETENENWGPQNWPRGYPTKWTTNISQVEDNTSTPISPAYFLTATSNQSKGTGTPIGNGDISEELMFTDDGSLNYDGVYDLNVMYSITGANLGEFQNNSDPPWQLDWWFPSIIWNAFGYSPVWLTRNPSITITSTGQKLAAWEHLSNLSYYFVPGVGPIAITSMYNTSAIKVARTNAKGYWGILKDAYTELANDDNFFDPNVFDPSLNNGGWLLNPSVTAFPMTPLTDAVGSITDQDPGAAELLFWQQDSLYGTPLPTKHLKNHIWEEQWFESWKSKHWDGTWHGWQPAWLPSAAPHFYTGANSQRSFGIYNNGPRYNSTGNLTDDNDLPYVHGLSYALSNDVASGGTGAIQSSVSAEDMGALKDIGTYDTAQTVRFYRSETRRRDSSLVTFIWGKVYVEDTLLDEPIREVILHPGVTDSDVYVSHDALRDSIFQTEWFNWPTSAEIKYDRLMTLPTAGLLSHSIDTLIDTNVTFDSIKYDSTTTYDTIPDDSLMTYYPVYTDTEVIYDTVRDSADDTTFVDSVGVKYTTSYDSAMVFNPGSIDTTLAYDTTFVGLITVFDTTFDTVPGAFAPDTLIRTDSGFIGPGISMNYTVELIHVSGHIDTIEQLTYDPYLNEYITPKTVTIDNASYADDTVRLQVVGTMTGIPDADSDVEFDRITMFDNYPSIADTTLAIGTGGGILSPPDSCFFAMGPYENPSAPGENDVSVLVHYCGTGSTITAQVYDGLGNPVGTASTYTSDGQTWDRLPIYSPLTSGSYTVRVSVGGYFTTLGYTVY